MLYDVAVIGAGPAGSTAAKCCAMGGLTTLMLDSCVFPRAKTCGGGLSTATLNSIGSPLPKELILDRVNHLESFFGDRSVRIAHPSVFMVITDRSVFDNYLVEQALATGVMFRQNETLAGLTKTGDFYTIHTQNNTYRAKAVIGADGVHSTTARLAGIPATFKKQALALSVEIPVDSCSFDNEAIKIFYGLVPQGYGWIFPKGDRVSIGAGCFKTGYHTLHQCLQKIAAVSDLTVPDKVKGHYIPYGRPDRDIVTDGIVLTGDAAGFIDPFTGEGIKYAIISGLLAGETLRTCFHENLPINKKNLAGYVKKCRQAFLEDLRYSYILSRAFFAVPSVMHRFLFARNDMYNRFLSILEGRYTYRSLVRDVVVELPKYYAHLPGYMLSRTGQTRG